MRSEVQRNAIFAMAGSLCLSVQLLTGETALAQDWDPGRWSGPSIGLSVIYGDGATSWDPNQASADRTRNENYNSTHAYAVHTGYDHATGALIVGLHAGYDNTLGGYGETDCRAARGLAPAANPAKRRTCGREISDAFWIGGKAGLLVNDKLLAFAEGGYANAELYSIGYSTPGGRNVKARETRERHGGFFAGGGIEWAIDQNWSLLAAYRYYEFDTSSDKQTLSGFPPTTGQARRTNLNGQASAFRLGITYRF